MKDFERIDYASTNILDQKILEICSYVAYLYRSILTVCQSAGVPDDENPFNGPGAMRVDGYAAAI